MRLRSSVSRSMSSRRLASSSAVSGRAAGSGFGVCRSGAAAWGSGVGFAGVTRGCGVGSGVTRGCGDEGVAAGDAARRLTEEARTAAIDPLSRGGGPLSNLMSPMDSSFASDARTCASGKPVDCGEVLLVERAVDARKHKAVRGRQGEALRLPPARQRPRRALRRLGQDSSSRWLPEINIILGSRDPSLVHPDPGMGEGHDPARELPVDARREIDRRFV